MTPAELQQVLREKKIPELLLVYGQESFLVERIVQQVKSAVLPEGTEDFNFTQFSAKDALAEEIISTALTLPVFSERRLVLIKNVQQLPATTQDQLLEYLQNPASETCLLLTGEKIDSRRKFFQTLRKRGAAVEFKPLYENQLPAFVREQLSLDNFDITGDALTLFCSRVGTNLQEVRTELGKLQTYLGALRLIDVVDVQAVVSKVRSENVFDIGNAVARGETGKAFSLSKKLIEEGEAPLKILSLLVRHYRQLWKLRELQVKGKNQKEMASLVGLPPFFVDGMLTQAKRFSSLDFRRAFNLFLETDLAMKSSGANPGSLLEALLLNLAQKKR
ncbi:MAG TPA: DNA polymerase III subunit delta [Geopsychrobacteraceae bacterium]|nr:DNA polymerase III subunit delta [Geopsychrobacteraceae bacterium]